MTERCSMGVGCDEYGVCYAEAHGQPEKCPHAKKSVPCSHIAEYYQRRWEAHKCIAFNLLRHGYRQWSEGRVLDPAVNNLFAESKS